jgi:hypothetical protein
MQEYCTLESGVPSSRSIPQQLLHCATSTRWRLDRILPLAYKKRILATAIACKIIYKEGLHFMDGSYDRYLLSGDTGEDKDRDGDVQQQDQQQLASGYGDLQTTEWCLRYLIESKKTEEMIALVDSQLQSVDPAIKVRLMSVLEKGGALTGMDLQSSSSVIK